MRRLIFIIILIVGAAVIFLSTYQRAPLAAPVEQPTPQLELHSGPIVSPPDDPSWQQLLDDYDLFISDAISSGEAPGVAVAIVRDSVVIFLKGYGLRDAGTGDSVDIFSTFRLGSVSKPIAAVLTGVLVDNKIIHWDDKVVDYLPGFRLKTEESTTQITLRHLLSHTTGLPYHAYTDRVDDGALADDLIFALRDVPLVAPPGKVYSYQNVAYSIIGKVIESATGKPLEAVMMERVFGPLHMEQASMNFQTLSNSADRTLPHIHTRKGWKPLAISENYYSVGPAGGVNASISDMALWLKALTSQRNKLLSDSTRAEIFTPAVRATARNRYFRTWKRVKSSYYGLGWRMLNFNDDTLNYHGGYVNNFRSEIAIKEDEHLGICVLVNSAGPLADRAIPEFFRRFEKFKVGKEFQIIDSLNVRAKELSP